MARDRPPVTLDWARFASFEEARRVYGRKCCIYVQADAGGNAIRVGKASKGLMVRYRGGTSFALDAAMHGSSNQLFVAAVAPRLCTAIENALIFEHRAILTFNNLGKKTEPARAHRLVHRGTAPRFVPPPRPRLSP